MIDINLNAVPDWERSRRDTEPQLSDVSRGEAPDAAERGGSGDGSNGVEISEEDADERRRAQARRNRSRPKNDSEANDDDDVDFVDEAPPTNPDPARYDEDGDRVSRARRGQIVDTDA